jgi:hypothetical protein
VESGGKGGARHEFPLLQKQDVLGIRIHVRTLGLRKSVWITRASAVLRSVHPAVGASMSKLLEWHTCPHCGKEKYCPTQVMTDHVEDCRSRPVKRTGCVKCGEPLMPVQGGAICSSHTCDYVLYLVQGGKQ